MLLLEECFNLKKSGFFVRSRSFVKRNNQQPYQDKAVEESCLGQSILSEQNDKAFEAFVDTHCCSEALDRLALSAHEERRGDFPAQDTSPELEDSASTSAGVRWSDPIEYSIG